MSTAVEILFLACSSVLIFNVNKGLTAKSPNFPTCKSQILVVEVFP